MIFIVLILVVMFLLKIRVNDMEGENVFNKGEHNYQTKNANSRYLSSKCCQAYLSDG
jgi:hypothetical protein